MPCLIVLAGPPCSGKSFLARRLSDQLPGSAIHAMDDVRISELPDSVHSKSDRDFSYRRMHSRASASLASGVDTVILDATYGPFEHRREAVDIATNAGVPLYLVECRVDPDEAVFRYRGRLGPHAGVDLDEARVRQLASNYPFSGAGHVIDTSSHRIARLHATASSDSAFRAHLIKEVTEYVLLGTPVLSLKQWTGELAVEGWSDDWSTALATEPKQSPWSRRRALQVMAEHGGVVAFALALALVGVGLLLRAWATGGSSLQYVTATAWISAGIMAAALFAMAEFLARPSFRGARDVARSIRTITFGEALPVVRTDPQICSQYQRRVHSDKDKRFAIPHCPIYFLIPPHSGKRFDVLTSARSRDDWNHIEWARRARSAGFDWGSYYQWRRHDKGTEYYGPTRRWEAVLRACGLQTQATVDSPYFLDSGRARYGDYLVAEQGLDIEIPGQVPYLRELAEGRDIWQSSYFGWSDIDLDDLKQASLTFPMMVSTAAIVISADGFLLLQRKSQQVQSAGGGVASSATGAVSWRDVTSWRLGPDRVSFRHRHLTSGSERYSSPPSGRLKPLHRELEPGRTIATGLFREIREEIGIERDEFDSDDVDKPFIGAAMGLRYGRDLNFYALLKCNLDSDEIAWRFLRRRGPIQRLRHSRRDRWEVAHLFFVDPKRIDSSGQLDPWLDDIVRNSRHVRAALHSVGVFRG